MPPPYLLGCFTQWKMRPFNNVDRDDTNKFQLWMCRTQSVCLLNANSILKGHYNQTSKMTSCLSLKLIKQMRKPKWQVTFAFFGITVSWKYFEMPVIRFFFFCSITECKLKAKHISVYKKYRNHFVIHTKIAYNHMFFFFIFIRHAWHMENLSAHISSSVLPQPS